MSRKKNEASAPADQDVEVSAPTPDEPAKARRDGLQIDGFGLPVNGPARQRILEEMGADEPIGPEGSDEWTTTQAGKARELTEKYYG